MDLTIILLIAFGAIILFLIIFMIVSQKNSQTDNTAFSLLQNQINQLTQSVNQQLQNMSSQFQKTSVDMGSTLGNVREDMGKMKEVTKEVLDKAKSISNLENLLRAPKFRGGLGELFLGDLLAQILPPAHYKLQHKFKSGDIVDAVVQIGSNLVPIDAKFPLENFQKQLSEEDEKTREALRKKFIIDVKRHISDIAEKYILPDENTFDFALMYIPAENIYYETIIKDENLGEEKSIFSYALKKRVIPVSPNSFFAYLQVIVLGLKGLQIEKSAKSIFQALSRLQGDITRFRKDFQLIGAHMANARNSFDKADKRLDKFSDRLLNVSSESFEKLPEKSGEENEEV